MLEELHCSPLWFHRTHACWLDMTTVWMKMNNYHVKWLRPLHSMNWNGTRDFFYIPNGLNAECIILGCPVQLDRPFIRCIECNGKLRINIHRHKKICMNICILCSECCWWAASSMFHFPNNYSALLSVQLNFSGPNHKIFNSFLVVLMQIHWKNWMQLCVSTY